jgi:UDP-glucose 4-epimerase
MRLLLTGASSFTGAWFATELADRGHEVVCPVRSDRYDGVRGDRVERVRSSCRVVPGVVFGGDAFLRLLGEGGWDVVCHHAATVAGYRDPGFDVPAALAANTRSADRVAAAAPRLVVTGSVFEPGEGEGDAELRAFSPYGLSKCFTAESFRYHCGRAGTSFGKFVIPNPFGPLEEERYTTGLVRAWLRGEPGSCRTPDYVRDNIHVSLLARAYALFVEGLPAGGWTAALGPSGYRESQRAFTERFAREVGGRLGLAAEVRFEEQEAFEEPVVRVNRDELEGGSLGWDEQAAWDRLAAYYDTLYRR